MKAKVVYTLTLLLTLFCFATAPQENRFREVSRLMNEGKKNEAIALLEELSKSGSDLERRLSKSTLLEFREIEEKGQELEEDLQSLSKEIEREKERFKPQNIMHLHMDLDSYALLDLNRRISDQHRDILSSYKKFQSGELSEKEYNKKLYVYHKFRTSLLDAYFQSLRQRCVESMDSELGIISDIEKELWDQYGIGANQ